MRQPFRPHSAPRRGDPPAVLLLAGAFLAAALLALAGARLPEPETLASACPPVEVTR